MHVSVALCLTLLSVGAVFGGRAENFEDIDFENMLKNEDQRKILLDCLMDRGPCGEFQKLRDTVPTMVETKCSNCSPKQKEKYEQVTKMLIEKYPKEFEMVSKKYSPKSD